MTRLLIATQNAHKTREIREMLGAEFDVSDLSVHPEIRAAEETGVTFEENAVLKANEASHGFDGLVLADDSGLEVDALGGAPGVRSARYASENTKANSSDEANGSEAILASLNILFNLGLSTKLLINCFKATGSLTDGPCQPGGKPCWSRSWCVPDEGRLACN